MHGEPYSLTVKIAPMSAMFFKAKNMRIPEDDLKKEGEKKKAENKAKKISVEELQSMMAENPQFQKEIASLLEKMSGEGMQP